MKKFISVLLIMFMLNFYTVGCVSYAREHNFEDIIWVGGVQVTVENKDDVLNDGGSVKYDYGTDTLTLTDAAILNESGHGIYAFGLNLTVVGIDTDAPGNNTVSGKSTVESGVDEDGYEYTLATPGCGILVEGDGYEGNGGLTITGNFGKISGEDGAGISAYRNVSISADVEEIYCTGGIENAINSFFGCVIITENTSIDNIISEDYIGIGAEKDIIISGRVGKIIGSGYAGIHTTSGDVFVSGVVDSIIGLCSGIEAYKGIDWDMNGDELSIGGSVKIGGTVDEISGGITGIRADSNLNLDGRGKISVSDVEDEGKCAVSAGGEIIISDDKDFIIEPKEYKIGTVVAESYENEDGLAEIIHNTICESDGQPALVVEFNNFVNMFDDVSEADWYYEDVKYAVINGLFKGAAETSFEPQGNLTRAMLVTVLYRIEGEPATNRSVPFADIDINAYYANAVIWAQQNGIVNGVSETEFAPDDNVTREQIATIIYRYAQTKGYDVGVSEDVQLANYDDFGAVHQYANAAVRYALGTGVIKGKTNRTIAPRDIATRAETAAILRRFIKKNIDR